MKRRRRVYDQLERKFVSGWLGRKEARLVRNTITALTPAVYVGGRWAWDPSARFICTNAKRKR